MFVREIVLQESPIFLRKVEQINDHLLCGFRRVECCKYTFSQNEKNGNNIILEVKKKRESSYKKQIASRARTTANNHHGEKLRFKDKSISTYEIDDTNTQSNVYIDEKLFLLQFSKYMLFIRY